MRNEKQFVFLQQEDNEAAVAVVEGDTESGDEIQSIAEEKEHTGKVQ